MGGKYESRSNACVAEIRRSSQPSSSLLSACFSASEGSEDKTKAATVSELNEILIQRDRIAATLWRFDKEEWDWRRLEWQGGG